MYIKFVQVYTIYKLFHRKENVSGQNKIHLKFTCIWKIFLKIRFILHFSDYQILLHTMNI